MQFDGHNTCHVSKNISKGVLERRRRICCFFGLRTNKKCHSDRKAKASTPQNMKNTKLCVSHFKNLPVLLDGAQLEQLPNATSGSHLYLFWNPQREISTAKLPAEHLQGRTALQKRKTKLFLIPCCHRWPSWQLMRHSCCLLANKIQLLHGDLGAWRLWDRAGAELKPPVKS